MDSNYVNGIGTRPYAPIPTPSIAKRTVQNPSGQIQDSRPFADVLQQVQDQVRNSDVHLSAHAVTRMKQRGLQFNQVDMSRLSSAITQAAAKGAKDAYVLYGDVGLVVNVPNRTVITAIPNHETTVVTNIDSVVVLPRPDR